MPKDMKLADDGNCFVCGIHNPIGFKLEFGFEGDEYVTYYTPKPEHQGWVGMAHGGFTCTVLDEVMARATLVKGHNTVTGELTVRFKKPARIGKRIRLSARVESEEGRVITVTSTAVDEDDVLVAEATAKMVKV